ncbi:mitochondrial import inner membrane translocase subunit Tim29 [Lucilia cuprina]|uniref:mitochondrial import inner membrane translocase subunit Tim29 n=1 Tax=Lucilia cuprina TaxID=7375 RepID=UPI001F064050|nr:mitochondrial import inner membrane translocase subunit Tim29 [Lucilia cuprina]
MRLIPFGSRIASIGSKVNNTFTLPERFKGTVVEKWANYWKGLLTDYKDVAVGLVKESKEKPRKALFYAISGYGLYQCAQRNPDEEDFHKQFRSASNNLILVHPSLQNPKSASYIRRLQSDLNQNRLRFLSLGICTILWEDLYDKDDCTYPAQCEYTQVSFWNFHEHIVDVGFWNQFWRLRYELYNFDVNYL